MGRRSWAWSWSKHEEIVHLRVAGVLELRTGLVRVKWRLWTCYSWCLMAPKWFWWLGGSRRRRSLYAVWSLPLRRWRRSILSEDLLLCEARKLNPWWVLQRGLGGVSTPRHHEKKSSCLVSFAFTFKYLISFVLTLALDCLLVGHMLVCSLD